MRRLLLALLPVLLPLLLLLLLLLLFEQFFDFQFVVQRVAMPRVVAQQPFVVGERLLEAAEPRQRVGSVVQRVLTLECLPGLQRALIVTRAVAGRGAPGGIIEQFRGVGVLPLLE